MTKTKRMQLAFLDGCEAADHNHKAKLNPALGLWIKENPYTMPSFNGKLWVEGYRYREHVNTRGV